MGAITNRRAAEQGDELGNSIDRETPCYLLRLKAAVDSRTGDPKSCLSVSA